MTTTEAAAQGAQLYLATETEPKTPTLYYMWSACRRSDGSVGIGLSYLSHTGSWQGSLERKPKQFASKKLTPIFGIKQGVFHINPQSGSPPPTEAEIKEAWERL